MAPDIVQCEFSFQVGYRIARKPPVTSDPSRGGSESSCEYDETALSVVRSSNPESASWAYAAASKKEEDCVGSHDASRSRVTTSNAVVAAGTDLSISLCTASERLCSDWLPAKVAGCFR